MGQNDGVENEKKLVGALNNKMLKRLTSYQQHFIKDIYKNVNGTDIVQAKKIGGAGYKPDVEIEVDGEKHYISVKKGSGNSVHQEKTEFFIHFCMTELDMSKTERDSLLLYLYGDGTLDGDSSPEERLKDQELIETYRNEINTVQKFLDRNKRSLIERFLIYGRKGTYNRKKADYLYHGDAKKGIWCPLNFDTIDYLVNQPNAKNSPLVIGPFSLQVWNRNLEGKTELEDRRHSIQIKWGTCKKDIEKINQYQAAKERERKSTAQQGHIIGNNSQGFENQVNLISIINNKRVSELPLAIKNIVKTMFPYVAMSERLHASKIKNNEVKPRISIEVKGEKVNITVFMGGGNSVHQEKIDCFINYCKDELGMTHEEEDSFLTIMFGDGTLDGRSTVEDRLKNTVEIKEHFSKQATIAQAFFDSNKEALIKRFLVYGKSGEQMNIKTDYIYYGTNVTGIIVPISSIVDYLNKKENSEAALLSLGSLTVQPWNRNLTGKMENEHKRYSLQVKWGRMKQDLSKIYMLDDSKNKGTSAGNWEEYELVSKLNRDIKRTGKLWKFIGTALNRSQLEDIYAVRVSKTVYSKLSEKKVLPKTDVYLVKGQIAHSILLDNNYWLDEDAIADLDVMPLPGSGISCKRPDSKHFTYIKLTQKSFMKLFNDPNMGAGISLFVNENDINLNSEVFNHWNTNEKEVLNRFSSYLISSGISSNEWTITNIKVCKIIKENAINNMREIIVRSQNIANGIFKGTGFYDEPYNANYIYINGALSKISIPNFSITTGSGRHKGIYTIIIKP